VISEVRLEDRYAGQHLEETRFSTEQSSGFRPETKIT